MRKGTIKLNAEEDVLGDANDGLVLETAYESHPRPFPKYTRVKYPTNYVPLEKGVNMMHNIWMWGDPKPRQPVYQADFDMIAAAGFDHVRLCIAVMRMLKWDPLDPSIPVDFTEVDRQVTMAMNAGLDVIVDLHTVEEYSVVPPLDGITPDAAKMRDNFVKLWVKVATHFKDYPQNRLAFEVVNEPMFWDTLGTYHEFRDRCALAIRSVDPLHLILAPPHRGGAIDTLWQAIRVPTHGVGYVIHWYEPHPLTHNLAGWLSPSLVSNMFYGLLYPYNRNTGSNVEYMPSSINPQVNHALVDAYYAQYMAEQWNFDTMKARTAYLKDWAEGRKVKVYCTECGILHHTRIYRNSDNTDIYIEIPRDQETINNWLHDVVKSMEFHGVHWTIFDYQSQFGLTDLTSPHKIGGDGMKEPTSEPTTRVWLPGVLDAIFAP